MSEQIIQLLIVERDRLERAIEALQGSSPRVVDIYDDPSMPDWVRPASKKAAPALKKKGFSAATRRKMAEGQKRRWAAINAAKAEAAPKKRTMSAEGRQRIIDATKARWAKVRAAKAAATAPKKKAPSKKSAIIAAITPTTEETEFKAKMSAAMKASWAKRKKAVKKKSAKKAA